MPTPTKTPQPCSAAEGAQLLEAAATLMKGGEEQASLALFGWQLSYRKRSWCAEPEPQSLYTHAGANPDPTANPAARPTARH
eukprot:scaffold12633_cov47-Phaeocystis_antarctica.AAC.2